MKVTIFSHLKQGTWHDECEESGFHINHSFKKENGFSFS